MCQDTNRLKACKCRMGHDVSRGDGLKFESRVEDGMGQLHVNVHVAGFTCTDSCNLHVFVHVERPTCTFTCNLDPAQFSGRSQSVAQRCPLCHSFWLRRVTVSVSGVTLSDLLNMQSNCQCK